MFVIPSKESKKFSQPNTGDTQGNLATTFNMDTTTNLGRVRIQRSKRVLNGKTITDSNPGVDLDPAMAFAWFDFDNSGRKNFIAYMGVILTAENFNTPYTLDGTAGTPVYTNINVGNGDMLVFNSKLYVTDASSLHSYNTTTLSWTDVTAAQFPPINLQGGVHQMTAYGDRLYIVGSNATKVFSMNTAETIAISGSYTLQIPVWAGTISWIKAGSNRIWIGCTSENGTRGNILEWDGQSENIVSKNYFIEAQGSCGCAMWNDTPYVLDSEGRLLGFNGSGFEEVARFPFIRNEALPANYLKPQGNKMIHFNGIIYANDRILMNIDSQVNTPLTYPGSNLNTLLDKIPGGVWEYTKENGLIHLNSPSMTDTTDTSPIDYGWAESTTPGAIFDVTPISSDYPDYQANYIYGARSWTSLTGGSSSGLFIDDLQGQFAKIGTFSSSWLESNQVADVYKAIVAKFKKLSSNNDIISIKYRTINEQTIPVQQAVTWTNATTFTFNAVSPIPFDNAVEGYEVIVTSGIGAGDVAHIVSITKVGNDYTVVLDKPIVGVVANDVSTVIVTNFKKLKDITGGNVNQYSNAPLPNLNKDIQLQFKVVCQWSGDNELYEVMVVNDTEQYAK